MPVRSRLKNESELKTKKGGCRGVGRKRLEEGKNRVRTREKWEEGVETNATDQGTPPYIKGNLKTESVMSQVRLEEGRYAKLQP